LGILERSSDIRAKGKNPLPVDWQRVLKNPIYDFCYSSSRITIANALPSCRDGWHDALRRDDEVR
jgi:hypothetical protein